MDGSRAATRGRMVCALVMYWKLMWRRRGGAARADVICVRWTACRSMRAFSKRCARRPHARRFRVPVLQFIGGSTGRDKGTPPPLSRVGYTGPIAATTLHVMLLERNKDNKSTRTRRTAGQLYTSVGNLVQRVIGPTMAKRAQHSPSRRRSGHRRVPQTVGATRLRNGIH